VHLKTKLIATSGIFRLDRISGHRPQLKSSSALVVRQANQTSTAGIT